MFYLILLTAEALLKVYVTLTMYHFCLLLNEAFSALHSSGRQENNRIFGLGVEVRPD